MRRAQVAVVSVVAVLAATGCSPYDCPAPLHWRADAVVRSQLHRCSRGCVSAASARTPRLLRLAGGQSAEDNDHDQEDNSIDGGEGDDFWAHVRDERRRELPEALKRMVAEVGICCATSMTDCEAKQVLQCRSWRILHHRFLVRQCRLGPAWKMRPETFCRTCERSYEKRARMMWTQRKMASIS